MLIYKDLGCEIYVYEVSYQKKKDRLVVKYIAINGNLKTGVRMDGLSSQVYVNGWKCEASTPYYFFGSDGLRSQKQMKGEFYITNLTGISAAKDVRSVDFCFKVFNDSRETFSAFDTYTVYMK